VRAYSAEWLSEAEMPQSAILTTLEELLAHGIRSEAEAVYLLAETRKLLKQQDAKKRYEYLTFHCDWALHAKLTGSTAQRILKLFDDANVHLKAGAELEQLSGPLKNGNRANLKDGLL
jgi:hypothetical protein